MTRALAYTIHAPDQARGLRLAVADAPSGRAPESRALGTSVRLAVTSGKGGVGKTTITANLAALWARRGKKTLVIDADLGLACLDLALGVKPTRDLVDVIEGRASLEETLVEGPFGATLLPAGSGRYELANLGPAARASLLRQVETVAARFEVVLIDTGAGIGATTIEFAALADAVLLVVTPDPAALRDAYAMAKVLALRASPATIHVLVNQVEHGVGGERVHDRLATLVHRFLDVRLSYAGAVARDRAIAEGVAHGFPFVLAEPRSHVARVLGDLVSTFDREVVNKPC